MIKTKFVFSYTELRDFGEPLEVTMEVPERNTDEMCEHFQRFLTAAGYLFENDEKIRCVPTEARKSPYFVTANDTLTFGSDDSSYVYDFGGDDHFAFTGSHVKGAYGEDIISFS